MNLEERTWAFVTLVARMDLNSDSERTKYPHLALFELQMEARDLIEDQAVKAARTAAGEPVNP